MRSPLASSLSAPRSSPPLPASSEAPARTSAVATDSTRGSGERVQASDTQNAPVAHASTRVTETSLPHAPSPAVSVRAVAESTSRADRGVASAGSRPTLVLRKPLSESRTPSVAPRISRSTDGQVIARQPVTMDRPAPASVESAPPASAGSSFDVGRMADEVSRRIRWRQQVRDRQTGQRTWR
jgi:hypothetical protein